MGERSVRIREVESSSLFRSTIKGLLPVSYTHLGPVYNLPFRELYLTMLAFDGARSAAAADEALAAAAQQLLDEPLQELHTQAAGYQICLLYTSRCV